jgi:LPS sulfotransferase NodH
MDQLKLLHSEQNSDVERLNTTFGKAAFIFLSRKNKLEQAISCVKAMQTGLWHTALALILQNSSRRSLNHVNQSARNARSSNIKHD